MPQVLFGLVIATSLALGGCGSTAKGRAADAGSRADLATGTGGNLGGSGGTGGILPGSGGTGGILPGSGGSAAGGTPGRDALDAPVIVDAPALADAPVHTGGLDGSTTGSGGSGGSTNPGAGGGPSTGGVSGSGGMAGSTSTGGTSGRGGVTGTGGTSASVDGGPSACQIIDGLDHTCSADGDCVVALHQSNCCGQQKYIGIRATQKATFDANESACRSSYPLCGCGMQPPMTDDGSFDNRKPAQVGVACLRGICTTYLLDCGQPCASGTMCVPCTNGSKPYAACTTPCSTTGSNSKDCPDAAMPTCQYPMNGSWNAPICTPADVVCGT